MYSEFYRDDCGKLLHWIDNNNCDISISRPSFLKTEVIDGEVSVEFES